MSIQGKVVWHDLMTADVEASKRFYGELFGWRVKAEGDWNLIYGAKGDEHFGSMIVIDGKQPVPSHWSPYFAVTDLDAAMEKTKGAGGKVFTKKMAAGTTGHFAVAADPFGAGFTLWQYASGHAKPESDDPAKHGEFCWEELLTADPAGATAFYEKLLGVTHKTVDMGTMEYTLLNRDENQADGMPRQTGGIMKMPDGVPHPFWCSYVWVSDCDAAVEKAQRLGAKVMVPAANIPNVGRFSSLLDPTLVPISILGPGK